LSIISLWLFFNKSKFSVFKFIKNMLVINILFLIIFISFDKLRVQVINSLELIFTGTDVALVSREHYNKFRWEAIDKSPIFGYGFIHKDANVMKNFDYNSNNRFMEKLGVQDSGYVDLLVRFGYLGTFIYLAIIFKYLLYFYKLKHKNYYLLPMIMFIFQYYFVNYTWAVFSFPLGTVPMIVTFLILFKFKDIYIIKK
jgi:O-antigen ligase